MSTEKMREEFEAWSVEDNQVDPMWLMRCAVEPEKYGILTLQKEWEVWQASRAAIEVELRDAYMKGWEASGEGWNGECPAMLHETERWQRERDQALGLEEKPC